VTLLLTEAQMIALRVFSGVLYGDGSAVVLNADTGAVFDVAGSASATRRGILVLESATPPLGEYVVSTASPGAFVIVTLSPRDPDDNADSDTSSSLQCLISALPTSGGSLYQMSQNYVQFGYLPVHGDAIATLGVEVTDALHRVVYKAPLHFDGDRFEYAVRDSTQLVSLRAAAVDVTLDSGDVVSSDFGLDNDGWTITFNNVVVQQAAWSGASSGTQLNQYIQFGQPELVLNVDNDAQQWHFLAPPKYIGDRTALYGGSLSFALEVLAADFAVEDSLRADPRSFVTLECDSCDNAAGITLAQRAVGFTGSSSQHFNFTLSEQSAYGWRKDPQDSRVTEWPLVSQCDFVRVLRDLSAIRVFADITTDYEFVAMDSFRMRRRLDIVAGSSSSSPIVPLACLDFDCLSGPDGQQIPIGSGPDGQTWAL
jgi:hypothetical protein